MTFSTHQITEGGRKDPTRRTENQDRILRRTLPMGDTTGVLLVVADGVTQCTNGGSVANWVVEKHMKEDAIDFTPDRDPAATLKGYLEDLYIRFKAEFAAPEYTGILSSGASLSVALLHNQTADCLWAGDSPIYHSHKTGKSYETQMLTRPDHERTGRLNNCFGANTPFALNQCRVQLAMDDILTVTSDGILVDDYTLSRIYSSKGFGPPACQEMLRLSKRGKFWDDLSIVAARVTGGITL